MFKVNLSKEYVKVPVDLLLKIHKSLASEEIRRDLEEYFRAYKKRHGEKEHLAEGFYIDEEGNLAFDPALYTEAVYRGKIDTRTKTAREAYEKLCGELELLENMGLEQRKALAAAGNKLLQHKICNGEPIAENSKHLLTRMDQVKRLLAQNTEIEGDPGE